MPIMVAPGTLGREIARRLRSVRAPRIVSQRRWLPQGARNIARALSRPAHLGPLTGYPRFAASLLRQWGSPAGVAFGTPAGVPESGESPLAWRPALVGYGATARASVWSIARRPAVLGLLPGLEPASEYPLPAEALGEGFPLPSAGRPEYSEGVGQTVDRAAPQRANPQPVPARPQEPARASLAAAEVGPEGMSHHGPAIEHVGPAAPAAAPKPAQPPAAAETSPASAPDAGTGPPPEVPSTAQGAVLEPPAGETVPPAAATGPAGPSGAVQRRRPSPAPHIASPGEPVRAEQAPEADRPEPSLADRPQASQENSISASPPEEPVAGEREAGQSVGPGLAPHAVELARQEPASPQRAGPERSGESTAARATPVLGAQAPSSIPARPGTGGVHLARESTSPLPSRPQPGAPALPVSEVLFGPSLASRLRAVPGEIGRPEGTAPTAGSAPIRPEGTAPTAGSAPIIPESAPPPEAAPRAAGAVDLPGKRAPLATGAETASVQAGTGRPAVQRLPEAPPGRPASVARRTLEPAQANSAGQLPRVASVPREAPEAGERGPLPVAPRLEDWTPGGELAPSLAGGGPAAVQLAADASIDSTAAAASDGAGGARAGELAQGRASSAAGSVDLDALARQVYDILRRRLRVEQERTHGRCG